jgi:hypothetical protein
MTVMFMVGRRVPKSWFRRQAGHVVGLITFQENIWMMIKQSLNLAKKKANAAGNIKFVLTNDSENEDMNYEIQWIKIMIQGTEEQEKEEYEDCMKLWGPLAKVLTKKELPKDVRFSSHFKTKMLNTAELSDAYKKGYGSMQDNNLSNKLLEMGILTHVKWDKDFEGRPVDIKKDM